MTTRIQQRYLWSIVIAGFGVLAMSGLRFAQGQDAAAQGQPDQGQATQMLVAHGLAMAIEGSTLESLAKQRGGGVTAASAVGAGVGGTNPAPGLGTARTGVAGRADVRTGDRGTILPREPIGSDVGTSKTTPAAVARRADVGTGDASSILPRDPSGSEAGVRRTTPAGPGGGAVGTGAGGAGGTVTREPIGSETGTRRTTPAGPGGGGAVGTGAGGAGGTVSREPYGSDADTRDTRGASSPTAAGAGALNVTGPAAVRTPSDPAASELHRHAMQAFEASDRLMKQALQEGSKDRPSRFQTAAARYAASLRVFSEQGSAGGITPVVVLNHGVKEALESMKLKQLVRTTGISDSPAGRALLAHAREMDTASKQAVESVLSAGKSGSPDQAVALGASNEAGGQGGQLRTLALQASEIVMALDELTGEGTKVVKENEKGSDSDQGTSKRDAQEKP